MLALLAQNETGANPLATFLPFLLIGGVFYFMILRPQQRRAKAQQALISSVDVGDEIVTTSGIYGTITGIDDEEGTLTVEIAPGTEVRILRAGVGRRIVDDDEYSEEYEDDEEEEVPSASDGSQEFPDQPGQIKER